MVKEIRVTDAGLYGENVCIIRKDEQGNYSCYSLDPDPDCNRAGMPGFEYFDPWGLCKYQYKSVCDELFKDE